MKFLVGLLTLLLVVLSTQAFAYDDSFVTFSEHPSFVDQTTRVSIGIEASGPGPTGYWFRKLEIAEPDPMAPDTVGPSGAIEARPKPRRLGPPGWTDTTSCRHSDEILTALAKLEGVQPFVLGNSKFGFSMPDGIEFTLDAQSASPYNGELKLIAFDHSPLANWVTKSLAILEPCWKPKRPKGS